MKNAVRKHCLKYVNLWTFLPSLYDIHSEILSLHLKIKTKEKPVNLLAGACHYKYHYHYITFLLLISKNFLYFSICSNSLVFFIYEFIHLVFFIQISSFESLESLESSEWIIFFKKHFRIIVFIFSINGINQYHWHWYSGITFL